MCPLPKIQTILLLFAGTPNCTKAFVVDQMSWPNSLWPNR